MKTTQNEATYRVALKRSIRAAGGKPGYTEPNEALEAQFKMACAAKPDAVALVLENLAHESAQAWVRGNNSGDSETMRIAERESNRLGLAIERVMGLLSVSVNWPGLYPSFRVHGYPELSFAAAIKAAIKTA